MMMNERMYEKTKLAMEEDYSRVAARELVRLPIGLYRMSGVYTYYSKGIGIYLSASLPLGGYHQAS